MKYLAFFMVFFYLSIGLFLLFGVHSIEALTVNQKNALGCLLIVYALYRGYRQFKNHNNNGL
jgi:ABC-type uncharacterized transport system permease subunit